MVFDLTRLDSVGKAEFWLGNINEVCTSLDETPLRLVGPHHECTCYRFMQMNLIKSIIIAEPKGEATNRDALSFRVCIYVCMYVCMYVYMYVYPSQSIRDTSIA